METKRLVLLMKARKGQDDAYEKALVERGFDVLFSPLFSFTWCNHDKLISILQQPDSYCGLIFTSQRSIESLQVCLKDVSSLSIREAWFNKPVYVVGPETRVAAQNLGFKNCVEGSDETGNATNLALMITSQPRSPLSLLFLCGTTRRSELPDALQAHSIPFTELPIYSTKPHQHLGLGIDALERVYAMIFFSPAGVRTMYSLLTAPALRDMKLFCIGPSTAAELTKIGLSVAGTAQQPTPGGLLEAVMKSQRNPFNVNTCRMIDWENVIHRRNSIRIEKRSNRVFARCCCLQTLHHMQASQQQAFAAFGLQGKSALVTGSTAGIGFAIAAALGRAGAVVWVNGRTEDAVKSAIEKLTQQTGGIFKAATGDLSSEAGAKVVFDAVGPNVDVLVNNVGIFPVVKFEEITDAQWLDIFNVNVLSGVRCSRYYLKGMMEKNWGRIIFIASESGFSIPPEMIHYGVSKTCQISLARGLAELTKGTNVTVNTVLPGPTWTPGVEEWVKSMSAKNACTMEEMKKKLFSEGGRSTSLKGTFLSTDEVANAVLYVASTLSSATNGATIRAEGGMLRHI